MQHKNYEIHWGISLAANNPGYFIFVSHNFMCNICLICVVIILYSYSYDRMM